MDNLGVLVSALLVTIITGMLPDFIYSPYPTWRITLEFRYFSSLSMKTLDVTNFDQLVQLLGGDCLWILENVFLTYITTEVL
ncbi:hypothetical protein APHNP_0360 [Anaplasma phagocytophilum str. ApNP]|uniref:Uncharacterized protein n=1 Tax=Anaplasma phagocytophilum str. ApNP TaxID=1359153 RepID=A0A0F3NJP9_ANAPH|nr:hypothetical protein APHNP_0360 [Anaplasma phagocytophilum str. ApNP]